MLQSPNDTIVAVSSAAGHGARGIIRLTGENSITALYQSFKPSQPKPTARWSKLCGFFAIEPSCCVPAKAYIFRGPRSYTGQDMAELHLPGSPPLLQMALEQFLQQGCRLADPGEFTARAFFNGRLDLSEAEAVAEVINAQSDAQLKAAQSLLQGDLHRFTTKIQNQITDVMALIESTIDFSEEEIEFASIGQLTHQLQLAQDQLTKLLKTSLSWEKLEHLPQVLIVGPANAGKSTLTNALLKIDRSVVSQIAGTTRDLLTAALELQDGECLLIDTAGMGQVQDALARQSQALTKQAVANVDLLLWVFDAAADEQKIIQDAKLLAQLTDDMPASPPIILVANKIDEAVADIALIGRHYQAALETIPISAAQKRNLDQLTAAISAKLHLDETTISLSQQGIALTTRQRLALQSAHISIANALDLIGQTQSAPELIALELRDSLDHLAAISGQVVPDDVLDRIFSQFCIGK